MASKKTQERSIISYFETLNTMIKPSLKDYVISRTSETFWKSVFSTKINITRLMIDCSQIKELHSVKDIDLLYIKRLTRNLCFAIHTERLKKLNEG